MESEFGGGGIGDFLAFRRMLIPILIQAFFWLASLAAVALGIASIARDDVGVGFAMLFLGPLLIRLFCEYIIVFFKINDTMTEVLAELKRQSGVQSGILQNTQQRSR